MTQRTKADIWPVDKPFIVFMVPAERSLEYAAAMNALVTVSLSDLGWANDSIEAMGLIAASPQHGIEGLFFLEESGVNTRSVTLLMLWGEASECVNWGGHVPEECGIGTVILPATGVLLPTVRMPSLNSEWWMDPLNQEYAVTVLTNMIRDIRWERDGSEPFAFVVGSWAWN